MQESFTVEHKVHWWQKPTEIAKIILSDKGIEITPNSQIQLLPQTDPNQVAIHLMSGDPRDFDIKPSVIGGAPSRIRSRNFKLGHHIIPTEDEMPDGFAAQVGPLVAGEDCRRVKIVHERIPLRFGFHNLNLVH